ncbi:hypothetical protein C491_07926 [Natronococcus amylolyticus DSM 10524]|uniref:Uncharacterized protein n=1 Tax=Natronococcus amylolyticus DSM 10524 TaxID=1227497 RepID=L9XF01_9EURY|nr:hypothetical protein C491_07926 [Natronococcus amylolyticus DSM 10524]
MLDRTTTVLERRSEAAMTAEAMSGSSGDCSALFSERGRSTLGEGSSYGRDGRHSRGRVGVVRLSG